MTARRLQPADLGALSSAASELAQVFVSLAVEIAWLLDDDGRVIEVAQDPDTPLLTQAPAWVGRHLADCVSVDSRPKIERLLADLTRNGLARRREVNHPRADAAGAIADAPAADVAVAYTGLRLGTAGPALIVGRDLRAVSAQQQRFQSAQLDAELGHWRQRLTENRHRLLLQVTTDAVLAADVPGLQVVEGNAAALVMLDAQSPLRPLAGRELAQQFDASSRAALEQDWAEVLAQARRPALASVSAGHDPAGTAAVLVPPPLATGRDLHARLAGSHTAVTVRALALPADAGGWRLLLRVRADEPLVTDVLPLEAALARLVEGTRDAIAVTDARGHVLGANRALVRWAHQGDEDALRGRPLADFLGVDAPALAALLADARRHGLVQNRPLHLAAAVLNNHGGAITVLASAVRLFDDAQNGVGLVLQAPRGGAGHAGAAAVATGAAAAPLASPLALGQAIAAIGAQLGSRTLADVTQQAGQLVRLHLVSRALDISATDDATAVLLNVTQEQLQGLKAELAAFQG